MESHASQSRPVASVSFSSEARLLTDHPQEAHVSLRFVRDRDLVDLEVKAGRSHQLPIGVSVVAAEEHLLAQPLTRPVRAVRRPEGGQEEPSGGKPPEDVDEQLAVLFSRKVRDGIERHHAFEGVLREL